MAVSRVLRCGQCRQSGQSGNQTKLEGTAAGRRGANASRRMDLRELTARLGQQLPFQLIS